MILDQNTFTAISENIVHQERTLNGIGTLREKTVHAVMKQYLEPDKSKQEIKVGKHVADIFSNDGIIEIQTSQFNRLRDKLTAFLPEYSVTIVYPVSGIKTLYWVDQTTGEISKGRRSPKKDTIYDMFFELYKIKNFLTNPNLHFMCFVLSMEEYRYLNGWSQDKKRGSSKLDRIPTAIEAEYTIHNRMDYIKCIPKQLIQPFNSTDFANSAKISKPHAQMTLNILLEVGIVERIGKQGRLYLYQTM